MRPRRRSIRQRRVPVLVEMLIIVAVAVLLASLIKTFIVQPFSIPSGSMNDTLKAGDRVLVSKSVPELFDVHRGDVVVFADPGTWLANVATPQPRTGLAGALDHALTFVGLRPQDGNQFLIKRTIGVGGDRVACCTADGRITVNGVAITETYLKPGSIPSEIEFDITVPDGYIWVMGDNRQDSLDSRYHRGDPGGGSVSLSNVVGTAFVRPWPLDRLGWMTNPGDVFADVPDATAAQTAQPDGAATASE